VVPISLYEVPSQLHHVLRHYKSGAYPGQEADFSVRVVSLLAYFLRQHEACIEQAAGGGWDVITTVPSSRQRTGEHPLARAIRRVQRLADQYEPMLDLGSVQLSHNTASDDGFRTTCDVSGDRILLIDDTFTTGATAQSAASRLNLDGATVVAVVPIGRVINPRFSERTGEFWDERRAAPFSFDHCCVE